MLVENNTLSVPGGRAHPIRMVRERRVREQGETAEEIQKRILLTLHKDGHQWSSAAGTDAHVKLLAVPEIDDILHRHGCDLLKPGNPYGKEYHFLERSNCIRTASLPVNYYPGRVVPSPPNKPLTILALLPRGVRALEGERLAAAPTGYDALPGFGEISMGNQHIATSLGVSLREAGFTGVIVRFWWRLVEDLPQLVFQVYSLPHGARFSSEEIASVLRVHFALFMPPGETNSRHQKSDPRLLAIDVTYLSDVAFDGLLGYEVEFPGPASSKKLALPPGTLIMRESVQWGPPAPVHLVEFDPAQIARKHEKLRRRKAA